MTYNDYWLAHHGILGQKWGVRNGPPYPLGSDVSTGSRLKEGASGKTSTVKKDTSKVKVKRTVKAATNSGLGFKVKTREYTIDEDVKAVNPKYNPNADGIEYQKYCQNCCYCSMAYEMRRRGYDVKAKPRSDDKQYHDLTDWAQNPMEGIINFKGESRTYAVGVSDKLDLEPLSKPIPKKQVNILVNRLRDGIKEVMPETARGVLTIDYYFGGGHSMMFDKSGDTIYVIDAQSGEKFDINTWTKEDESFTSLIGNVWVTRIDDLDVIPSKIKGACS